MTEKTIEGTLDRAAERTVEALNAVFGEASPKTIYSTPEQVGDGLVMTASAWDRAGGFGFGGGGDDSGASVGAGGGGASQGRPSR